MGSITRIKRSASQVPETLEEVDIQVGLIGTCQAQIDQLEREAEAEIRKIREDLRKQSEGLRKDRNALMTGVFVFAEANKAKLTQESKTVSLTNGSISWRWTPPAVSVEDDEAMIETLKRRGLDGYVRLKEELDRSLLLSDRETLRLLRPRLAGLAFSQKEEFVVKPASSSDVVKTRTIALE